jgi:hypothetical protein
MAQNEPVKPNASGRYRVNLGVVAFLELNVQAWLDNTSLPDAAGKAVAEYLEATAEVRKQDLETIGKRVNLTGEQMRTAILDGRITTDLQITE